MPEIRSLPETPEKLLAELFRIFPQYQVEYDGPIHDQTPTFHSVLIGFTPFFGTHAKAFSDSELRSFGELINRAVGAGGAIENAFGTCFLEHLHQIRASSILRPYLSKLAREKARA